MPDVICEPSNLCVSLPCSPHARAIGHWIWGISIVIGFLQQGKLFGNFMLF